MEHHLLKLNSNLYNKLLLVYYYLFHVGLLIEIHLYLEILYYYNLDFSKILDIHLLFLEIEVYIYYKPFLLYFSTLHLHKISPYHCIYLLLLYQLDYLLHLHSYLNYLYPYTIQNQLLNYLALNLLELVSLMDHLINNLPIHVLYPNL